MTNEKPDPGKGWEIINEIAGSLPEEKRSVFVAGSRFSEGAFTSGLISEAEFRQSLAGPRAFVFLGSLSEVPEAGIKLTRFGQRVELPEELAEQTKHPRGLPCIPAEAFDALGFTAEELRKYGAAQSHENAPAEFLQKKLLASQALHEYRGGE